MERAGEGVAREVSRRVPDGLATVLCGKGNNGGDGLVVARLLRDSGREVAVVCIAPPDEFRGDAAENLERLPGDAPLLLAGRRALVQPCSSTRCSAPASPASHTARR